MRIKGTCLLSAQDIILLQDKILLQMQHFYAGPDYTGGSLICEALIIATYSLYSCPCGTHACTLVLLVKTL